MRKPGVVIVGGGVFGTSIACHLAAAHAGKDVLLIERMEIASAASCQAAGLMFRISSKPAVDRLSRSTFRRIQVLEQLLEEALDFRRVGTLRLADSEKSRSDLEALYRRAKSEGISAEKVDAPWCRRSAPWLVPGPETRSVYFPDDGYIDPYRLAAAYTRAAARGGVRIETGVAVHSIRLNRERIAGLETSRGFIPCETVVLAAGAWSNRLTMPLGVALPMIPTRSHYWIAAPESFLGSGPPMAVHGGAEAYTRPEVRGMVFGVQEAVSRTFDHRDLPDDISTFTVTEPGEEWDALMEAGPRITRFFPALNDLRFENYVAGLSSYTPDGHFVLGTVERPMGLYVAAGCCGSGVMASGGIGEALAGLILHGESPHDLSPFRPERFGRVDPFSEAFRRSCAEARTGKLQ